MKNSYGLGEILSNIISLVYTKVFYKGARFIRRPIYVRGKRYLTYGKGFSTGYGCRLEMFDTGKGSLEKILIGENCKIGDYVHIAAGEKVTIGSNCLLASKIFITDISHGNYTDFDMNSTPDIAPDQRPLQTSKVSIGKNVWIGENVTILPGVNIGDGVVIGANAVVNKNIPANSIAVGCPAKVVKIFNKDENKWMKL
ncbi:DapH/DapD/GlmU-related protein [Paenibacillus camerounensis]|uniref:DapH/DapD/GlmU-related protein n=1 Tax=Paenibacillus camerounensis TaxID=1243663 RepID=UPI000694467E|nr:DapH/DapD/GlmU-related protein [Paenibacillus camerounensis]